MIKITQNVIVLIISCLYLTQSIQAQPRLPIVDNIKYELINIHGVKWERILALFSNNKAQTRSFLKDVILDPNKFFPNDKSNAGLAYNNALVGYGHFVSFTNSGSTRLESETVNFYRDNLQKSFERNDENFRQALYSSLRFTGSIDALELLYESLEKEKSLALGVDILNYAKDILDGGTGLQQITNTPYSNMDLMNLSQPFYTRGAKDDWGRPIEDFLHAHRNLSNKFPTSAKNDARYMQSYKSIYDAIIVAKKKYEQFGHSTGAVTPSNPDNSDPNKSSHSSLNKVVKSKQGTRAIASSEELDRKPNSEVDKPGTDNKWFIFLALMLITLLIFWITKKIKNP